MKKYKIEITFVDGNIVRSCVEARNKSDALRKLKETDLYKSFANSDILTTTIEPTYIHPIENTRFYVTNVVNKNGWYIIVDFESKIKVEFKKGMYNETQRVIPFRGIEPDAMKIATALREIGEFLYVNFKELV